MVCEALKPNERCFYIRRYSEGIMGMKQDVTRQGQTLFDNFYMYYTKTEQLDSNTACGFITGAFITTRKLAAEAFERKKLNHP